MVKVRKVQDRSIANRQKLVKAGSLLFAQKGVFHTNAKEIARTADLAGSNFYTYYRSKIELFNEVVLSYYKQISESVSKVLTELSNKDSDKHKILKDFYLEQMKFIHYTDRIFEDYSRLDDTQKTVTEEITKIRKSIIKNLEGFLIDSEIVKNGKSPRLLAVIIFSEHIPHINNIIALQTSKLQDEYIETLIELYKDIL